MSRRDAVLEALRAEGTAGLSGSALAARLGVTRTAIAKHVARLRSQGYDIESRPRSGYALLGVPDEPLPAEVARYLTSRMWARIDHREVTGSTNVDAAALARAGAAHGTAVIAEGQTAGKGRLGRVWESPPGGVYVSAVVRPSLSAAELAGLPLAVALGVARGLRDRGVEALIKWPNDVVARGGKLAGVLLEMAAEADRVEWLVIGVGMNVRRPAEVVAEAVYLDDVVSGMPLAEAAALVLDGIAVGYESFIVGGMGVVVGAFDALDLLRGRGVCVRDGAGRVRARGVADGVDREGRLVVRVDTGERVAVASGDATLA